MKRTFTLLILMSFAIFSQASKSASPITISVTKISCEKAFLGIQTDEVSIKKANFLNLPNPYGSYVTKVYKNSAAEKAGLKPFDYIVGINEDMLTDETSLNDLLSDHKPSERATLRVIRNGQALDLEVTFGKMDEFHYEMPFENKSFLGVRQTGPEGDEVGGVMVDIVDNSTAKNIGLQDGDIITEINGYKMYDWNDISAAIQTSKPGEEIQVKYIRNDQQMVSSGTIASSFDRDSQNWMAMTEEQKEQWEDWAENQGERWEEWGEQQAEKWEEWGERFGEKFERKYTERFQDSGSKAFLGIYLEKVSAQKAKLLGFDNPYGSYVKGVIPNTAAHKAGVEPFDYIYGFDTYRVGEDQSFSAILSKFEPGDEGTLHIFRKGERKTLKITLGTRMDAEPKKVSKCDEPFFGVRNDYGSKADAYGVKISPVSNSTAEAIGLQKGDIIHTINGNRIIDWTDVSIAVDNAQPGKTISVEYERDGKKGKASGKLKTLGETKECEENEWDIEDDFDFDMNFDFDENTIVNRSPRDRGRDREERRDISNMSVNVQKLNQDEAKNLGNNIGMNFSSGQNLKIESIRVAPNPNEGLFKMDFELPESGETSVKIFNNSGRMIYEYDLGNYSGTFQDQVDISQNGKGIYLLEVKQDNKSAYYKIVLQ
ncbi:MAG: PDZ domain-containing protein [Saprospiraceae bacterium]